MEVWKEIKGYDNYKISSYGNVMNMKGKVLNGDKAKGGYHRVTIRNNKKAKRFSVHRLVAINFLKNPNNYPIVGHIDNNPSNNKVDNLEWCTQKQNLEHAAKTGGMRKGLRKGCYLNKKGSIPIYGVCLKTGKKIKFPSISEAIRRGFNPNITHVIRGKYKQCGGYKWFKQ